MAMGATAGAAARAGGLQQGRQELRHGLPKGGAGHYAPIGEVYDAGEIELGLPQLDGGVVGSVEGHRVGSSGRWCGPPHGQQLVTPGGRGLVNRKIVV